MKKILVLSDHPLVPSGVGTQTKYLIDGLLKKNPDYSFFCLGGAIKHPRYDLQVVEPDKYGGDRWKILPVNGYGDKNLLREVLRKEKPDGILMVTDPRFFTWVWEMEDEIRKQCPMMYWHVWDNDPIPEFNKVWYDSTDYIACISLKTYGLLQGLDINRSKFSYVPHALPEDLFYPVSEEKVKEYKEMNFGPHKDSDFIVFWNNRNARRKQTGDVVACFAKFSEEFNKFYPKKKTSLMMNTDPKDPEGQDVLALAKKFGVESNVIISEQRVSSEELNMFYNVCDCTINIASNEGFGLGTLESLYAGNPIVVHMTGGLQFQIGDWWDKITDFSNQDYLTNVAKNKGRRFGVPVFSASRSCTGSQQIPYIYDDRVNHDDVVKALHKLYEMGRTKRRELGIQAREWALKNFNMNNMVNSWDNIIESSINFHRETIKEDIGIRMITI